MGAVLLGMDVANGEPVRIGDIERRSGLYILGKPGMGKSALTVGIAIEDIINRHGIFFLDAHGDAILALLDRCPSNALTDRVKVFDIEDKEFSVGINLLHFENVEDLQERNNTYTRVFNIFNKIWEDDFGPWLQLILQNILWAFIENQDYTLADVPMFLNPRYEDFRNHIIDNIKYNPTVANFWRYEFFSRQVQNQQERVDAALTRINILLSHQYVRDIIGQQKTTIDFNAMLAGNDVWLFKLSANLAEDQKKFIGTILISELLHAVRNRDKLPEEKRTQFCIFIDEFHNFASSNDMGTLVTEGRKFGVACTFAHVERFGQLAHNQKLLGATLATASKVFFQLIVPDAIEMAPEISASPPHDIKLERELVISQNPVFDLMRGHIDPEIRQFVNKYLRYMHEQEEDIKQQMQWERLQRLDFLDESALDRLDVQMLGGHSLDYRTEDQRARLLSHARNAVTLAQAQTENLMLLYGRHESIRLSLRFFNRFLTALMENRVAPGQEEFYAFLIDRVRDSATIPKKILPIVELYMLLLYGDATLTRSIPIDFANANRLFTNEIATLTANVQEQTTRIKQEFKDQYFQQKWNDYKRSCAKWLKEAADKSEITSRNVEVHRKKTRNYELTPPKIYFAFLWLKCYPEIRNIIADSKLIYYSVDERKEFDLWRTNVMIGLKPQRNEFVPIKEKERNTLTLKWSEEFIPLRKFWQGSIVRQINRYLKTHRAYAADVLQLLEVARHGKLRGKQISYYSSLGKNFYSISDIDYPSFNYTYELDLLRLTKKLNEFMLSKQEDYQAFFKTFRKYIRGTLNHIEKRNLEEKYLSVTPFVFDFDLNKRFEVEFLRTGLKEQWKWFAHNFSYAANEFKLKDEVEKYYLICHACDSVIFGYHVAEKTFPLVSIKQVTIVNALIGLLEYWKKSERKKH